jgi:hypothetical protein
VSSVYEEPIPIKWTLPLIFVDGESLFDGLFSLKVADFYMRIQMPINHSKDDSHLSLNWVVSDLLHENLGTSPMVKLSV